MAIIPETSYAGKIEPASSEYPYGEARNITTPGDGTGTPFVASLVNDMFGIFQALLSAADIVPSGSPDNAVTSQYLEALKTLFHGVETAADVAAVPAPAGARILTKGLEAAGDGGGQTYFVQATNPGTADGEWIIALDNGNFAVRDKELLIAEAPAGSSFGAGTMKYLFMDPAEWRTANGGGNVLSGTNQFHFFSTADPCRVEFESNPGEMNFYIEGGVGKEAWYGIQQGGTTEWSFGINPAIDESLRFVTGFGIGNKNPPLTIKKDGTCRFQDIEATEQSTFTETGVSISPLITFNGTAGGVGPIFKSGDGSQRYAMDVRQSDETNIFRIKGNGTPEYGDVATTSSGYAPIGNGLILQWGEISPALNTSVAVTFPVAFPTSCLQFVTSGSGPIDRNAVPIEVRASRSPSGTAIYVDGIGSSVNSQGATWFAIGY